jgi:HK97 family phage major capsid protein
VKTVDKPSIKVSNSRAEDEAKEILESKSLGRYMGILTRAHRGEMYLSEGEKAFMHQMVQRKAAQIPLAEMTDAAGGFLVPQEWMDDILGLLRASAVVRLAGPRIIPFNKQMNQTSIVTGATAGYTAESSRITPAGMEFGEAVLLTPKNLTALVPISNYLLADAAGADAIVRQELVTIIALAEDFNFLRGTGAGGAPTGLLNISGHTNNPITVPTNGFQPSVADLRKIRAQFRNLNSGAVRLAWFFHSAFLAYLETLTDADGRFLLDSALLQLNDDGISGVIDGTPFFLSNQIPINLTQGSSTNATDLTLVNMDELIVGMNQDLELAVSTEAAWSPDGSTWNSAFQQNQTLFRAVIRHDINHRRPNQIMIQHGVLV